MRRLRRLLRLCVYLGLLAGFLGLATLGVMYALVNPTLPSVDSLRDVRLQVPLSVLSRDGKLIALFGETRRTPVDIENVPERVKQAFIAIEDARFYEHPGVDGVGVARAIWLLATTSDKRVPGGSTITQQVARMFFLSPEYSFNRKFAEMLLALKMERELSKDEIFELYLNKSFFGNRAYGIVAAAEFYYGKPLAELSLAEAATLASIPKFPSSGNPIINPDRALVRRDYVLQRMHELGFITVEEQRAAQAESAHAHPHEPPIELEAPYVAEMVRLAVVERYGSDALTGGYRVYTTLDSRAQEAASIAIRDALLAYDKRHGWRGAEATVPLGENDPPAVMQQELRDYRAIAGLNPGVVTTVDTDSASIFLADGQSAELTLESLRWAAPYISEERRGASPRAVGDVLKRGDIVRLARNADGEWELAQIPKAQGALVSLSPEDGSLVALAGGFNFGLNKFNRATQSLRQPGSSFKPFVYAAAFERGFTPASIVLDAPVVFHDRGSGKTWRPQNDNESFVGPMRLREAMVTSRNLVSVRILDAIGVSNARRYIQGFGFSAESLPDNLSLALGTSSIPPIALARGYTVFSNGGFLVQPYFIDRIVDRDGIVVVMEHPLRACRQCPERFARDTRGSGGNPEGFDLSSAGSARRSVETELDSGPPLLQLAPRVVDERTTFLIASLLRDVVRRGTGRAAMELGRNDLGGKTGSTNDHRDAWFSGFGGNLVTTAWVGMDDFSSLGPGEFGGKAALPMWNHFMRVALDGVPEYIPEIPNGITTALIDRSSGLLVAPGTPGAMPELFKVEDVSRLESRMATSGQDATEQEAFDIF
jgi:penicillin-binding protein 1A